MWLSSWGEMIIQRRTDKYELKRTRGTTVTIEINYKRQCWYPNKECKTVYESVRYTNTVACLKNRLDPVS